MKLVQCGIDLEPKPLNRAQEMRLTVKLVKYKLDAYVASLYKDLPETPTPWVFNIIDNAKVLIGGKFMVYTNQYILEGPRRMEYISTIKLAKKGLPRPPKVMLTQSEIDIVEKLTTEPPAYAAEELELKGQFIKQLQRTVNELFNKKRFKINEQTKAFFPSTSSNYNMTRAHMGSLSEVARVIDATGLRSDDKLVTLNRIDDEGDIMMSDDEPSYITEYDDTLLKERIGTLMHELKRRAMREGAHVEPVALAEAMKVRVITKGPPMLYSYLKPLQRFLHRTLKEHPVFQLIGNHGISTEVLMSQDLDYMTHEEKMNSGDYNDATNELQSWVSEVIARALSQRRNLDLSDDDRDLFVRALVGHVLYGKDQVHGSLMGSIVNFPVLCIANAALCRWAMEQGSGNSISLDEARLLINGDDCLFPINEKGRDFWIKVGKVVGLNVNMSKSFYTKEFLNINSRDYTIHQTTWDPSEYRFKEVKFLNSGILFGLKRSGESTGLADIVDNKKSLGSRAREMIKDCPFELRKTAMATFIVNHPELKNTSLPWHMPEWAGGIGLPDLETEYADVDESTKPWNTVKYKRDLSAFKALLLNWQNDPIPSWAVEIQGELGIVAPLQYGKPKLLTDQPIMRVHQYATERLRHYAVEIDGRKEKGKRTDNQYKTLYGLICCEWLFSKEASSIELNNYWVEIDESEPKRKMDIVRHNENLWRALLKSPNLPKPDRKTWDIYKGQTRYQSYLRAVDVDMNNRNQPWLSTVLETERYLQIARKRWQTDPIL